MYAPIHDSYDWRFLNMLELPSLPEAEHQTRILYIPNANDIENKKCMVYDAHFNIIKHQQRPTEIVNIPHFEELGYHHEMGMAIMYIHFVENEYYFLQLPFKVINGVREYMPELRIVSYNIPFRNRMIAKDIQHVIQLKIGPIPSSESLTNTMNALIGRFSHLTREC